MNERHIKAWTERLRHPEQNVRQGERRLCIMPEEGIYYMCCLGVGADMVPSVVRESYGDPETGETLSYDGVSTLAPRSFIEWLGLDFTADSSRDDEGYDLYVDWPEGLDYSTRGEGSMDDYQPYFIDTNTGSLAALNDSGFTFKQIADIIDYFGVRTTPIRRQRYAFAQ